MTEVFATIAWIASGAAILVGSLLVVVGAVGLVRMPDLYTRMHAAGIIDSCGGLLLLGGLAIHAGFSLVTAKLIVLIVLLFFAGPVATHALARAALHAGVTPRLSSDHRDESQRDGAAPVRQTTP